MQWHVWIRLKIRFGSAGDSFLVCLRCLLFRTLSLQFGLPHHNKSIFQRLLLHVNAVTESRKHLRHPSHLETSRLHVPCWCFLWRQSSELEPPKRDRLAGWPWWLWPWLWWPWLTMTNYVEEIHGHSQFVKLYDSEKCERSSHLISPYFSPGLSVCLSPRHRFSQVSLRSSRFSLLRDASQKHRESESESRVS